MAQTSVLGGPVTIVYDPVSRKYHAVCSITGATASAYSMETLLETLGQSIRSWQAKQAPLPVPVEGQ